MRLPWGLNVRHVYLAFFSIIAIATCGFSMAIYGQYAHEQALNDFTVYQYETMRRSRLILDDAIDMENSVRGYVISGDKRFLEPYTRAGESLRNDMYALRVITEREADTYAETDRWLDRIEVMRVMLDNQISTVRQRGRGAVSPGELDRQKTLMDELRGMLETSISRRFNALKEKTRAAKQQKDDFLYTLIFGNVVGIGILLAGTVVIIRLEDENERTEEEKNRAESRFRTVLSGVNDGLFELNFVNDYMYMSPEFKAMLGFSEDEIENTAQAVIELIHPDDRETAIETRRQYILQKTPAYNNIFRMRHKDGSWRWILSRGVGTWDRFGQIRNIIGTHTDITVQKEREEELRQLNADMEAFTYITSHDMRAPLVNLKGFSHELKLAGDEITAIVDGEARIGAAARRRLDVLLREDMPEALGFIGKAVDRMDTLTTAILDLSRIGRLAYRDEPVSAQAIFEKCLGAQNYEISSKNVEVVVEPLPTLITDPVALEQIFSNLLDNAVKYLRPDEQGRIEVSCRESARDYVFAFRDNGRGIAPEDGDRVFQVFRRARNSGEVRGLGIGMAFVKATLRRLSGAIWFESVVDGGTTFYVSLPKKSPDAEEPATKDQAA